MKRKTIHIFIVRNQFIILNFDIPNLQPIYALLDGICSCKTDATLWSCTKDKSIQRIIRLQSPTDKSGTVSERFSHFKQMQHWM